MSNIPKCSLVLNATFEPHCIVDWQRATIFVLPAYDVATAAEDDTPTYQVRSPSITVEVPHVLRLITYVNTHQFHTPEIPAKPLILQRDGHICQYCRQMRDPRTRKRYRTKATTVDHVIPSSRGGGSSWDNMVACCFDCNQHKGDRLPHEMGWETPKAVKPDERLIYPQHQSWEKYLKVHAAIS